MEKHIKYVVDISGFRSSKIPDQGTPDGNPAIYVYSGVVWVLDEFWSGYFYSLKYLSSVCRMECEGGTTISKLGNWGGGEFRLPNKNLFSIHNKASYLSNLICYK